MTGPMRARRFVVWALERGCFLLDRVPVIGWWLGCHGPFRWSEQSWQLDERWGTGVWRAPSDEPEGEDPECE